MIRQYIFCIFFISIQRKKFTKYTITMDVILIFQNDN